MRALFIFLLGSLLGGCGTFIQTQVSAFHEIDQPLIGATYTIVAADAQAGSLEYKTYSNLIKAEFDKQGMIETPLHEARYAVFLFYGIDNGKQVMTSYPIYGQTGTSSSYSTGTLSTYGNTSTYSGSTYNTPSYGVVGTGTSTSTVFKRYVYLDMVDIKKSTADKIHKVYEGKATSSGTTDQLSPVMPAIIRSIFKDFPGKSGSSRIDTQPLMK